MPGSSFSVGSSGGSSFKVGSSGSSSFSTRSGSSGFLSSMTPVSRAPAYTRSYGVPSGGFSSSGISAISNAARQLDSAASFGLKPVSVSDLNKIATNLSRLMSDVPSASSTIKSVTVKESLPAPPSSVLSLSKTVPASYGSPVSVTVPVGFKAETTTTTKVSPGPTQQYVLPESPRIGEVSDAVKSYIASTQAKSVGGLKLLEMNNELTNAALANKDRITSLLNNALSQSSTGVAPVSVYSVYKKPSSYIDLSLLSNNERMQLFGTTTNRVPVTGESISKFTSALGDLSKVNPSAVSQMKVVRETTPTIAQLSISYSNGRPSKFTVSDISGRPREGVQFGIGPQSQLAVSGKDLIKRPSYLYTVTGSITDTTTTTKITPVTKTIELPSIQLRPTPPGPIKFSPTPEDKSYTRTVFGDADVVTLNSSGLRKLSQAGVTLQRGATPTFTAYSVSRMMRDGVITRDDIAESNMTVRGEYLTIDTIRYDSLGRPQYTVGTTYVTGALADLRMSGK